MPTSRNALVLLQPRPQLQDILPNLTPSTATARLPNLDSAYVGIVKETGSLFAMTPARYPLVAFGGAERYVKGRLIDPPTEDDDLPTEVDAVTRARKYKERMEAWERDRCKGEYSNDRRCLVGVRKLEDGDGQESRMKRLLDGPIDGRFPVMLPGRGGAQPVEAIPTSNETVGSPTGISSPPNGTFGPGEGWTKAARGNLWEALAFTFVLGIVSLWFAVKRFRDARNKKFLVTGTEKEKMVEPVDVVPAKALEDPIFSTQLSAEPPIEPAAIFQQESLPPSLTPTTPVIKSLPVPNGTAPDDGDDSEREGEGDGDVPPTPGRRKARRGKRGKKKKVGMALPEDAEEEKPLSNGSAGDSGSKGTNPLPSSSLVINSPKPPPTAPSLVVSDTILGRPFDRSLDLAAMS
jgi:serine/threonine-protein kinase/endoribonuclease IRE1